MRRLPDLMIRLVWRGVTAAAVRIPRVISSQTAGKREWARLGRQAYRSAREQQRSQPQSLEQPLSQFVFESTGVYNYQWYPDLRYAPYGCPSFWQIKYRTTIDLDNNTVFEKQVDCRGVASVNGWHVLERKLPQDQMNIRTIFYYD